MKSITRLGVVIAAAGIVATSSTAVGSIIYTQPPTPIVARGDLFGPPAQVILDVDNDGVAEFTLRAAFEQGPPYVVFMTSAETARPGVFYMGFGALDPFPAGTHIGPPRAFIFGGLAYFLAWFGSDGEGGWPPQYSPAFMAFAFDREGAQHFGWARVEVMEYPQSISVSVLDYAYESVPGIAITAGAIPAPGAAALVGLASLAGLRRRRSGGRPEQG